MGSDRRLVSVIVPAYNCEHFIKTCIDSIQGQTYRCFEVIVVYDPSPDNTLSVLEKYRRDIALIKQKRKTSPAIARNEGLKIAKGQYIAFCDADDYFESRKLERQIKLMEKKDADITYTDVIYVDRNNNMFGLKFPEVSKDNIGSWMANPYIALSSLCVKKKLLEEVGGFDENLDTAEDFDLLIRLITSSRIIKKTPGFLTFYRIRSDSLSSSLRIRKDLNRIKIFKKYGLGKQILLELPRRLLPHLIIYLFTRPKEISQELLYLFER